MEAARVVEKLCARPALAVVLIVAAGLLVYSNVYTVPFQFDDSVNIDTPAVRNFASAPAAGLRALYAAHPQRIVAYLTFAFNFMVNGRRVFGYHLVNNLIHVGGAVLLYFLVTLTYRTPHLRAAGPAASRRAGIAALLSALLFVCHPVQTQAVTYIVQRLASLATFLILLSLVAYAGFRLAKTVTSRVLLYATALASALLAMKTKETAFTLPLMLTFYEFAFFNGPDRTTWRKRMLVLLPFLVAMAIIPLALVRTTGSLSDVITDIGTKTAVQTELSRWSYLMTEIPVVATYLRLLLFPAAQNLDYDYPTHGSLLEPEVFLSLCALAALAAVGVRLFIRSETRARELRLVSFGIFWFFVTLSVESSVIPIVDVIFEHRLYLPAAGAFMAAAAGAVLVLAKLDGRARGIATGLMVLVPLALGAAAYRRNVVWQSERSIWEDVVLKSPGKARGHNNLGKASRAEGDLAAAERHYAKAVQLQPDYIDAHYNLGNLLIARGRLNEGAAELLFVIEKMPEHLSARNNLGNGYVSQGRLAEAIAQFEAVLARDPDHVEAHNNLGVVYADTGRIDKAIEHYEAALKLRPDLAETHCNLGELYLKREDIPRARREFETALGIKPDLPQPRNFLNYLDRRGRH